MLNRASFFASLGARIAEATASGRPLALLMLRVRRLRETNRLLGYEVGEAFVDAVQRVVVDALRGQDQVWRIGDGDLAAILPGLRDRNHAALAAAKLVRALHAPLDAGGHQVQPIVSVGIATVPDDAIEAEALCRCADQACEDANNGSDRFAWYSAPEASTDFAHADLVEALAGNRLELHFQPILALGSGRVERYEALSRWNHPSLGPVPPEAFVRMAEQTGMIGELTRWSLNVALRHVAEAIGDGGAAAQARAPCVAVNVAVDALREPGFVEQVLDMLRLWDVPAAHLVLEITESGLMTDPVHCERMLRRLRAHGIGIAIDDFGTGYSSMAYLRRLPANELKIDRSFVQDMRNDPRAHKLVASMIDVSHHLGMTTVAEGVEDAEALALLRSLGCDYAQGYHIGQPAPAAQVMQMLSTAAG